MTTITQNPAEPTTFVRATVNERAFFQKLKSIFNSNFSTMGELLQNGRRAKASKLSVEFDREKRLITVSDDGVGVDDFQNLLELSTSGWTAEDVVLSEKPFGMGFFSVFYNCERVVVHSRGKMLSASLNDIIESRSMEVASSEELPDGWTTRIELHGVVNQLLEPSTDNVAQAFTFEAKLERLVRGFPLPVLLNGAELPRPFAQDVLVGEMTEVGFVSIEGVHRGSALPHRSNMSYSTLFLQGLPIHETESIYGIANNLGTIVHIDSSRFTARMPDRTSLYDASNQLPKIFQASTAVIRQHLIKQKAILDAESFIRNHWNDLVKYDIELLANDIPFVPMSLFSECQAVIVSSDSDSAMRSIGRGGSPLVSREQLLSGHLIAWRDAPETADESAWAATLMKVMKDFDIKSVDTQHLDRGHWLYDIVPSALDFEIKAHAIEPAARSSSFYCESTELNLRYAQAVKVVLESKVDEKFCAEYVIDRGWCFIPNPESIDESYGFKYECLLLPKDDHTNDHPVNAMSNFYVDDRYDESWESDEKDQFEHTVAALRNDPLVVTVGRVLDKAYPDFSQEQTSQCTLVRIVSSASGRRSLQAMQFGLDSMTNICAELAAKHNVQVQPEQLADVISHLFKPGEVMDGPNMGHHERLS